MFNQLMTEFFNTIKSPSIVSVLMWSLWKCRLIRMRFSVQMHITAWLIETNLHSHSQLMVFTPSLIIAWLSVFTIIISAQFTMSDCHLYLSLWLGGGGSGNEIILSVMLCTSDIWLYIYLSDIFTQIITHLHISLLSIHLVYSMTVVLSLFPFGI